MPTENKTYDLVILGGGPAGLTAAITATANNKTVALIDCHHELGGAGINTGTVPSKTLRETALALSGLQSRNLYGVDLSLRREVTVSDFLGHEQKVKSMFNTSFMERLESEMVDVIFGFASFVDPHTVSVKLLPKPNGEPAATEETLTVRGNHFLIATGSSPVQPGIFPFNEHEVYDSDEILQLARIPKTMAVIGSGVIGSEYACTFAALNSEVHILDGRDKMMPFLDTEISAALVTAMEKSGIKFHWKENVLKCEILPSRQVLLTLSSGATMTVDAVLVAAGRKSNVETLNLAAAGVTTGERGLIPVNDHYCTNVPHIFAAGDVIGFPALASTSMEQARRAASYALDAPISGLSHFLPNGIYTIPEVSMVGETEETLKKQNVDYVVGRGRYAENGRGGIIGDKDGFLKLLFRRDNMKLVGVHVIGELATEIVHIGLMAMLTEQTAEIFIEACFNVPTLSALYKQATLDALKAARQKK